MRSGRRERGDGGDGDAVAKRASRRIVAELTPSSSHVPDGTRKAYRETVFIVHGTTPIELRIGVQNSALASLYVETLSDCAAFVTGYNSHSEILSDAANAERQATLEGELRQEGWKVLHGVGRHPSGNWPGEPSLLVLGTGIEAAMGLGKRYEQNAIVWCGTDAVPQLVILR